MDNLDDSENTAKVSDSAYSNSCSNSQCRRSHSSKSTHSGSHSSGSSGYGGKPSTSGSSKTLSQLPEKIKKDKEGKKKKKQVQTETAQNQTDVEFRLPDPAPITGNGELQNASPPPVRDLIQKEVQRSLEVAKEDKDEKPDNCNTAGINQSSMQIVMTRPSEGFSCVISMHDGVVLYMSPSLTATLGFPKDIWIGRSFIDFVHPLDHNTFASQMTSGLVVPKAVNDMLDTGNSVSTIFCRIRRYRALSAGFNVKERTLSYMPFMLQLTFKNVYEEKGAVIYLVIQAMPVFSAFKTPNEVIKKAMPFIMRHVANGTVEYVDNVAVQFLGYLPQDITSKDVLKLYHPEDLPYLKHVYETVVKYGRVPRSKPYRLMAQNGDYIKFETEWSSFINPWSRKLEFVIGKHYVTEGPANPDVFQPPSTPKPTTVLEADNIEIEGLRASIVRILNEVSTTPAELVKQQMAKRCQDLASFMESVINEQPKVDDELRLDIQENDNSYYERDSVMLGGISPHHDYGNDSKSSSETLLSYNQLNFTINLKRYFDSHQESFDEDSANVPDTSNTTVVALKEHISNEERASPIAQCSGDSVEMTSAESPCVMSVDESPVALPHDYQSVRLTESIMTKHNSEMEKIFVKKHRTTKKEERDKLSNDTKQKKKDHLVRCNASFVPTTTACSVTAEPPPHGLKRPSKHAEAEPTYKHHCVSPRQIRRRQPGSTTPQHSVSTPAPKWPQNSVNGMTPFMSQQVSVMSPMTPVTGFVPMYYMSTAGPAMASRSDTSLDPSKNSAQVPLHASPVQYMMYGQAVFGSPIMVSPINHQATFPRQPASMQNTFISAQSNIALTTSNYEEAYKAGLSLKPASKAQLAAWREESRADAATFTRGGACSGGSMCSATNALNRSKEVVSESSALQDSKMKSEETVDRTDGESSYSSFYSSFFKTESGSAEDSDAKNKQNNPNNSGAPTVPENDNLRNKQLQRRKKEPPWMEQVCVTSELIYKYQVVTKSLDEVLLSDRKKLAEQPSLVNEQLGQLYMDLQLEGVAARLTLEEGVTSSGSSSDDGNKLATDTLAKRVRRKRKYSKLVMIYEEDIPLPSPEEPVEPESEREPQPSTSVA